LYTVAIGAILKNSPKPDQRARLFEERGIPTWNHRPFRENTELASSQYLNFHPSRLMPITIRNNCADPVTIRSFSMKLCIVSGSAQLFLMLIGINLDGWTFRY
jgi:hypothetical protein